MMKGEIRYDPPSSTHAVIMPAHPKRESDRDGVAEPPPPFALHSLQPVPFPLRIRFAIKTMRKRQQTARQQEEQEQEMAVRSAITTIKTPSDHQRINV